MTLGIALALVWFAAFCAALVVLSMSFLDDPEKAGKKPGAPRLKPFIWFYAWRQRGRLLCSGWVCSEAEGKIAAEAHIRTVDSTHVRYMDAALILLERRRRTEGSLAQPLRRAGQGQGSPR